MTRKNRLNDEVAAREIQSDRVLRASSLIAVVLGSVAASLSYWTYRHFGGTGFFLPMLGLIAGWISAFRFLRWRFVVGPRRRLLDPRDSE